MEAMDWKAQAEKTLNKASSTGKVYEKGEYPMKYERAEDVNFGRLRLDHARLGDIGRVGKTPTRG